MKSLRLLYLVTFLLVSACTDSSPAGPAIREITTSSKVLAKSDCTPTSVIISARVDSEDELKVVALWFRIGEDQEFTSTPMIPDQNNIFTVEVIALEIPGGEYGPLEFYITAEDRAGNQSKSRIDKSVELLPCVG